MAVQDTRAAQWAAREGMWAEDSRVRSRWTPSTTLDRDAERQRLTADDCVLLARVRS